MINILYLEDNRVDIDLTRYELEKSIPGCTLFVARTIGEIHQLILEKTTYDVAILDLKLPDGDGIDALLTIRKMKLPIPVIILTGSGNENSAIAALKAGADDYLPKNQGYLKKLPLIIKTAIKNFHKNSQIISKPLKVLYTEWNKADIDLTIRHMQKYAPHIQIDVVATADAALRILPESNAQDCPFEVLIMDYRLPGLNALDTIKIIRQERKLPISIIIVTGHGNEEVAVQALKLGANEYLVKSKNYLYSLPSLITNAYQNQILIQQQEALRESEEKYRLIAENSNDVIFIMDLGLNYKYVSPSVKDLRGFEVKEVLKQNIKDILTPDSYSEVQFALAEIIALKNTNVQGKFEPRTLELEMYRKDGTTVWVEVRFSILIDDDHIPIGVQGVTRDISRRKAALDELHVLSRAIEQSPATVIITDVNGNIEYVNPKFTRVTGYSLEEVLGKNPRFLKAENTTDENYSSLWQTIIAGETWSGEFQNVKKDGTKFWEFASISPIRNKFGQTTHFLAINEDITQKKKFESELIIARDQAEESNRLKSAFLATMSHELRTPLNAIIGFSELASTELDKSKMIDFCKIINKSGNHLLKIIEDIFTVSMLQTGQSKPYNEEFALSDFILSLHHYTSQELKNKNKTFLELKFPNHKTALILLKTDKTKLYQVLINFIKNAIEFTEKGTIEVGYIQDGTKITFYVKDTGVGIPGSKTKLIFERFRQADDSDTRKHSGVGLGLAICYEITKLLNGKIWVESQEEKGSTFYFSLENVLVQKKTEKITVDKKTNYPDLKNKTILIVEDNETNFQLLETYIAATNANIIWAKNGEESVNFCRVNPNIHLVLMDIRMQGINGFEAARQIKKLRPELKIIAQTAYALPNDRLEILQTDCDDYISKPVNLKIFMDLLKKYLA